MTRRILTVICLLLAATCARAQVNTQRQPDCYIEANFTAATRSVAFDNRPSAPGEKSGCTRWTLSYYSNGFSALSIELDEAPDASTGSTGIPGTPGSWVVFPQTASGALPLTVTTSSQITVYKFYPWVSINLNSVTGTGLIKAVAMGWKPDSLSDASSSPAGSSVAQTVSPITTDPCQSPAAVKTSVPINITTATTTSLVALSGSTIVYVCGFAVTVGSTVTANTIQFEYGTGGTCGAGTTVLTGVLNTAGVLTGEISYGGAGQTVFKTAAANGLCAVSTVGTGPSIQGLLTFVQQ